MQSATRAAILHSRNALWHFLQQKGYDDLRSVENDLVFALKYCSRHGRNWIHTHLRQRNHIEIFEHLRCIERKFTRKQNLTVTQVGPIPEQQLIHVQPLIQSTIVMMTTTLTTTTTTVTRVTMTTKNAMGMEMTLSIHSVGRLPALIVSLPIPSARLEEVLYTNTSRSCTPS